MSRIDLRDFGSETDCDFAEPWTAAQAALSATDKEIFVPASEDYATAGQVPFGDGSDTQQASAKYHGVRITMESGGGGYGHAYAAGGRPITRLRYVGPQNDALTVWRMNGPFVDMKMDGRLTIDCGGNAGQGVEIIHAMNSELGFHVERPRQRFATLRARDVLYGGLNATPWGMADNTFDISCAEPELASTCGIMLAGGYQNNIGFCRNRGRLATIYGGGVGSWGFAHDYADNWREIEFQSFTYAHPNQGTPHVFVVHPDGAQPGCFPLEGIMHGAYGGTPRWVLPDGQPAPSHLGGRIAFPWLPTSDGGQVPTDPRAIGFTFGGIMFGKWAGSLTPRNGRSDPDCGLTSTRRFYPLDRMHRGHESIDAYGETMGVAHKVHKLEVRLNGTPGAGCSRTFTVLKNGQATPLSVTYGADETGPKSVVIESGVQFQSYDFRSLVSDVTGAPTNTNASWAYGAYPTEVM